MKIRIFSIMFVILSIVLHTGCSSPKNEIDTEVVEIDATEIAKQEAFDKATKEAISASQTQAAMNVAQTQEASIELTKTAEELTISQTQTAMPHRCTLGGLYEDIEGDVEIDYLDILKVETSFEKNIFTVVFYLKNIPTEITVGNNEDNPKYYWGVGIDIDDDSSTGSPSLFGNGIDFKIDTPPFFMDPTTKTYAFDKFPIGAFMWEAKSDGSFTIMSEVEKNVDYEKNTMTLSIFFPIITENSILYFGARQTDPDHKVYEDFLCN